MLLDDDTAGANLQSGKVDKRSDAGAVCWGERQWTRKERDRAVCAEGAV